MIENNNSNNQINELQSQLKEEKNINQKLIEENNKLKQENKNIKIKYENEIKKLNEKIKSLENEIENKNIQLQNCYSQIKLNENEITSMKPGERIIAVNFLTMGNQDITNYAMACKNTDLFIRLEEKLYNDYPKYKNYETYFEVNTRRIKRFKTIEENQIKNNDIISLFVIE